MRGQDVTLDPTLNHATSLKGKLDKKNNLLKFLAGTSLGKEKETLLTSYKAISGSTTAPRYGRLTCLHPTGMRSSTSRTLPCASQLDV